MQRHTSVRKEEGAPRAQAALLGTWTVNQKTVPELPELAMSGNVRVKGGALPLRLVEQGQQWGKGRDEKYRVQNKN